MEPKPLDLDTDKKQSLEAWVNEVMTPVVSVIGYISNYLETLYQELK